MSLITCCPACHTMFQVSGEDLRASDGWVRCGNCNGVFDASAHLQVMPPAQEESTALPAPSASLPSIAAATPPEPVSPSQTPFTNASPPVSVAERPSPFRGATAGDSMALNAADTELSPATLRREDRSARPSFSEAPVSFSGNQPAVRSRWRLTFWLLVFGVMAVALLGWARHERQALVQRSPALLSALDALCRLSACEVVAPRALEAIAMEGASMEEIAPSQFKIQLLLKNVGHGAVELPGLNVTLTGPQDEVLATHVALPSQFASGVTRLLPSVPLSVAFTFSALSAGPIEAAVVPADVAAAPAEAGNAPVGSATPPVIGYRVIAFYP